MDILPSQMFLQFVLQVLTTMLFSNCICITKEVSIFNVIFERTVTLLNVCILQRPQLLGVQREAKIANLLKENGTLLKLGIFFESRNMQVRIHETLEANYDKGTSRTVLVLYASNVTCFECHERCLFCMPRTLLVLNATNVACFECHERCLFCMPRMLLVLNASNVACFECHERCLFCMPRTLLVLYASNVACFVRIERCLFCTPRTLLVVYASNVACFVCLERCLF